MQLEGTKPTKGVVVPVTISADASHFPHRQELVYLPPAWFSSNPPPRLPAVMMISSAFNTPADWLRPGGAFDTIDDFAAHHHGFAPALVFVDPTGSFDNDTECVNGTRGNAADHLTKDVVPFVVSNFGVSADRANWGVAGWSMGGTCAVDLTVMHPEHVQRICRHRRRPQPHRRHEGPNHRPVVRRQQRRLGRFRPGHRHHSARPLHRGVGMVRRPRIVRSAQPSPRKPIPPSALPAPTPPPTRKARTPPPTRCAPSPRPTGSPARWLPNRASMTGRSPPRRSPRRCRGWPRRWEPPAPSPCRCRNAAAGRRIDPS